MFFFRNFFNNYNFREPKKDLSLSCVKFKPLFFNSLQMNETNDF